jgi:hypothetical protein
MINKQKQVLPFQIGEKYTTKFQVPEEVTLTRISPNPKGRPIFGYVIYTNSPHLGECPLNLDRIFQKVSNTNNKIEERWKLEPVKFVTEWEKLKKKN